MAQHNRAEKSKLFLQFDYSKSTGGEYYNEDGNKIHNHYDSTSFPGFVRKYAFEFSEHRFEINGGYEVLKKLDIICGFAIHHYSLQENFTTDTVAKQVKRAELLKTRFDNIKLGADYYLLKTNNFVKLRLLGTIPFSQEDTNVEINDNNDFLSSSPYEILAGIRAGMFAPKSYFEAETYYNYRSGDFSDLLIFGGTLGLSTVENTMLRIQARYIYALENSEIPQFNIRQMVTNGSYLDIGFGFWAMFDDQYYFSFDYKLRPLGENAWNSGTIKATFGVNIETN